MGKSRATVFELAKDRLEYNPKTGLFTWLVSSGGAVKGMLAGHVTENGYVSIGVGGNRVLAHRLAWYFMTGNVPDGDIDHINGDRQNNKAANLRLANPLLNAKNRCTPANNMSGVMGVSWHKNYMKWQVTIKVDGKTINLGRYDLFLDAVTARADAERKYSFHENHGRGSVCKATGYSDE